MRKMKECRGGEGDEMVDMDRKIKRKEALLAARHQCSSSSVLFGE